MAYTQQDLHRIKRAIARGTKRVTFSDRTVEFHSMSELIDARREIEKDLADQAAAADPASATGRLHKIRTTGF